MPASPVTVLVIGGHGQLGQQVTKLLVAANASTASSSSTPARFTVHSLIRNPSQIPDIEKLGATPHIQDLVAASVPDLLTTLSHIKPAVVVWAAGAGYTSTPEQIDAVDHKAAVKVFDALAIAASAGDAGKRIVSVSAVDVRDRAKRPVPEWYDAEDRKRSEGIWKGIGHFLEAKLKADRELRMGNERRGLEYTMVRPGGLSNEPGVEVVGAGKVHLGKMVAREDVARVVMACIEEPSTVGLAFDVVGGQDPVVDAVKAVGAGKVDTFEGYY